MSASEALAIGPTLFPVLRNREIASAWVHGLSPFNSAWAYGVLITSSSASSRDLVGMGCISRISQIVERNARPEFHRLNNAPEGVLSQNVKMTDDKNGGPNHLKAWRLHKRMTLEELAEKVGTSASVIGYLESGERGLSAKWLRRLAPALGTTPGFLLDHEPELLDAEVVEMWAHAPEPVRKQIESVVRVMAKNG